MLEMVVGKIQRQAQLESFFENLTELESFTLKGKFARKLKSSAFNQSSQLNWKLFNPIENLPTQLKIVQLQCSRSNFNWNFQLRLELFNFILFDFIQKFPT